MAAAATKARFFPYRVSGGEKALEESSSDLKDAIASTRERVAFLESKRLETLKTWAVLEERRAVALEKRSLDRKETKRLEASRGVEEAKKRLEAFEEKRRRDEESDRARGERRAADRREARDQLKETNLQTRRADGRRQAEHYKGVIATLEAKRARKDARTNELLNELGVCPKRD